MGRGGHAFRPSVRPVVLVIAIALLAYWLTVGLCALGYTIVPEWACKSTHLTAPN